MSRLILSLCLCACVLAVASDEAQALPKFKTAFKKKYLDSHKDAAFKKLANKQSCNVCHLKGVKKDKKHDHNNPYGEELAKLIEGNAKDRQSKARSEGGKAASDAELDKILKELDKAFTVVEGKKSPTGEKYGERINKDGDEGKLPVDLEVAAKLAAEAKAKKPAN